MYGEGQAGGGPGTVREPGFEFRRREEVPQLKPQELPVWAAGALPDDPSLDRSESGIFEPLQEAAAGVEVEALPAERLEQGVLEPGAGRISSIVA